MGTPASPAAPSVSRSTGPEDGRFANLAHLCADRARLRVHARAGAAYLMLIGLRMIAARPHDAGSIADRLHLSAREAFVQAILAEVLNPKTALFFLAFLPQFVNPQRGPVAAQLLILGIVFAVLGLFSTVVFARGAGRLGNSLRRHAGILRWQGRIVGTIYCLPGLRLLLTQR
ncbi:MAG: LysE family translocator [Burkholderiaceae bacterium]